MNNYPSKILEEAVEEFSKLPGIGKRTALRLVLHLLKKEKQEIAEFGETLIRLSKEIRFCDTCFSISDSKTCEICDDHNRDHQTICVVESIRDVMAIEKTNRFNGVYHVLGGVISPMDGVGPSDLNISSLEERIQQGNIKELILALSATMEGDTTNFYIFRKFSEYNLEITTLARGVAVGDELEYADELTLGRSIVNRTKFITASVR
ncbi:MAG: recombination protein RecR [Bacteroidales bacterium]|nr:recombination protein RecR [Bacteroidales bacterium]